MSGLYIHVPFCQRICVYCDFSVTTARKWFGRYTEALIREAAGVNGPWETLYLGGGTPSYLPPEMIVRILGNFRTEANAEVTMEANPNNITEENVAVWRSAGINRLSIGIQSFDEDELKFLTRNHSARQAIDCVGVARSGGFENIGLDLIFGMPGQSVQRWLTTLKKAVDLQPQHLSIYNLTYEPGTPLFKWNLDRKLPDRDEGEEEDMFLQAHALLTNAGYHHYEISNYALAGVESRHNRSYWNGAPYIGLGPSAHSFDGKRRWWNVEKLETYLGRMESDGSPIDETEILDENQHLLESILLGLRQSSGISMEGFRQRHGSDFREMYRDVLNRFEGLFLIDDERAVLTPPGWFLYDHICRELAAHS